MNALSRAIVLTGVGALVSLQVVSAQGETTGLLSLGYRATQVTVPDVAGEGEAMPQAGAIDLSPDGRLFVYQYRPRPVAMRWVLRIAATTGEVLKESLLATQDFELPGDPRFSPDGTRVLFHGPSGPMVVGADGEGARNLGTVGWDYGTASWRPDGMAIVVDRRPSEREDPTSLDEVVCLDATTGVVLWTLRMSLYSCRFSPDSLWLVGTSHRRLVAVEVDTGASKVLWDPAPLAPPGDRQWYVVDGVWTPNSRTVLFTAAHRDWNLPQGPATFEIWEVDLGGEEAQKLSDGVILAATVSGQRLLVDWRTAAVKLERKSAGEAEVQPNDLSMLVIGNPQLPESAQGQE